MSEQQTGTAARPSTAERRSKMMADGEKYRTSEAHRAAALTLAVVEIREAIEQQTEIQRQRLDVERESLETAKSALREQRMSNLLSFYSMPRQMVTPGVYEQLAAHLDIRLATSPGAAPASPAVSPATPERDEDGPGQEQDEDFAAPAVRLAPVSDLSRARASTDDFS